MINILVILSSRDLGFPSYMFTYSITVMPYYEKPQPDNFPKLMLKATNYSKPSLLPDKIPAIDKHPNLLEWLKRQPAGGDNTTQFARIFAAIRSEGLLTNGLMMLIYGTSSVTYLDKPTTDDLKALIDTLTIGATGKFLNVDQQNQLKSFLAEEALAFQSWISAEDPTVVTTQLLPSELKSSPARVPGKGRGLKQSDDGFGSKG